MPDKKNNVPRKKALNMNSPWLQNTLRSMGISATNALSDLMPATAGTVTTGAKLATEAARTLKSTKGSSKTVQTAIKNNPLVKTGQDFFKNALSDLRSGEWNGHDDRGSMGDMFDDMDTMFGDMDEMFDDEGTDVNVENNITADSGASIRAIERQTEYTVRSAQATVDTMVSIGSASLIKAEELGNKVLNELTGINSTLNAILEYQNDNVTRFIEASIGYYEQMSASSDASIGGSESIQPENLYGDKGLDFRTYKDYVMQNIKNLKNEDGNIGMLSMFLENAPDMLANPMDMAAKGIIKAMIPAVTKNAMAAIDQSMKDFVPYLLERIGSLGDGQTGIMGTALQYVGKIFGTKTTAKKELDFSNIKTGPIPYNGKANHTIIEIIPKYLRESNNYLRVIAEHLTGKDEEALSSSVTGFNWQTGRFQKMGDMKKSMQEDYVTQVLSGLETSEFGKKFLVTANTVLENSSDTEGMSNILQQILMNAMQSGKRFNFGDENQIQEIVDGISGSENQKNFVMEFLSQMKEQRDEVLGNLENLRISTVRKNNTLLRGLNDANGENGIYQLYAGRSSEDILADINAYLRGAQNGGNGGTSEDGGTPPPTPGPAPTIQSRESLREAIRTNQNDELDLEEINNSGGGVRGAAGRAAAKPLRAFAGVLNGIMAGNADAAWDAFIAGFGETFKRAGNFISEHFLNPVKGALFGEKNEDGYIKGGLFGGINNRMKESFYGLRRMITGKGYKDAEGNMIADANEEEMKNTVVGKLRSSVNWMKDAISVRLFGKKTEDGEYETDEDGKAKDGLLGKAKRGITGATSSLLRGLTGWKHALFGKSDDEEDEETEGKKIFEDLKKKAADVAPSAMTGAIGGGILGMFVGGPIGGALLGFAGGIASKSDRFKNWLFGTDEKDGVIPKKVQDYVKENGKFLAGGAAIGALKGAITGGGILGTLVGGPIAGALMGLGTSIFLKSDMFQKFWFGDKEAGQLGMKQHIAQWTKSLGMNTKTGDADSGKLAGMMGIGAVGGGILGMMVGGPVLGALGGLSLSILAQKDNFKEWLFGKVDKETGEKKEGVLGQFKNMLITEIGRPIKTTVKYIVDDFKGFFKYNIVQPVGIILGAAGDQIASTFKVIGGTIGATIGDFGHYIKENFLSNVVAGLGKVFAPMTKAATTIAEGMYSAGKAIVSAPIKLISAVMSPAAHIMATAVKGVTTAIGTTVKIAIVKPLEYLVVKPLGAAVSIASKIIAAPFKLIGNTVSWVNDHLIAGLKHITRFFGAIGEDIKMKFMDMTKKIGNKIHEKVIEPIQKFVLAPIKIIGEGIKEVLYDVGQFTKKKISGFFSKALSIMNPFNWIKGVFNLGKKAFNLVGSRFGFGNQGGESEDGSQRSGGYFRRMWNQTKAGATVDHSNTLVYDKDGNIVDSKLTLWRRIQMSFRDGKQVAEGRKQELKANRAHDKNASLVRKYTKGQRADDTEESRLLAERMAGHKINWKGKAEETKTEKFQDESLKAERRTAEYVEKLYSFITGKKIPTREDREAGKATAEKEGFDEQRRKDSRQARINELGKEQGYHAKRDVKDAKSVDKRVTQREKNLRREQIDAEIASGADARTVLGKSVSRMWGKLKGHFTTPDEEIPANAEGTSGAKPGLSIVGEKGPEVIYGKNAKSGKFVGLGGPEVIRMKGGETVIPNNRLPKYEDGTDEDVPSLVDLLGGGTAKSDDAISQATDTSKLTLGERVLRTLSEIKTAILSKVGAAAPQPSIPTQSVTGELNEEPEAAATLAPAPSGNIITDSSSTDMVNDGEENSMADQLSAQAVVSGKTGEAMRAEHAAIQEQAEDDARKDAMLAAMQGTHEETKKHGISWDSIFSKKGLVTAALLAGIPFLLNWLKNFKIDIPGTIIDVLGNITDNIIEALKKFFPFLDKNPDNDGNPVDAGIEAAGALIDAQEDGALGMANPLARVWHNKRDGAGNRIENKVATHAKRNMLIGQPFARDFMGVPYKSGVVSANLDEMQAIGEQYGFNSDEYKAARKKWKDSADDLEQANSSQGASVLHSVARQAGRVGIIYGGSSLAGNVASGIATKLGADEDLSNTVGNLTTAGTAAVMTADITRAAVTGKTSMVDKILDGLQKMLQFIAKRLKMDKKLKSIAKSIDGFCDKIYKATVGKITNVIVTKIQAVLAKWGISASANVVTLGLGYVAGALSGLASGYCSTEHLFMTLPDDADPVMKIISSSLGAAFGALEMDPVIGWAVAMIDVLDTILIGTLGTGIKQFLAQNIYVGIMGENSKLAEKQREFNTQLAMYNQKYGTDLTAAQFNDKVNSYGWADALLHGKTKKDANGNLIFDDAGGDIEGGLIGAVMGGEKDYVKDAQGNVIKDAEGNAVVAKDQYGNTIKKDAKWGTTVANGFKAFGRWFTGGDIYETDENGKAVWDEETQSYKVKEHQGNVFQRAGKGLSNAWNGVKDWGAGIADSAGKAWESATKGVSEWWTGTKEKASEFIGGIGNGIKNFGNGIKDGFMGIVNKVKGGFDRLSEENKRGADLLKDPDSGFEDYFTVEDDPENPVGGFMKVAIVASRLVAIPQAVMARIGRGIKRTFDKVVGTVTKFGSRVGKSGSDMFKLAKSGDVGAVMGYTLEDDPENPVGGFTSGVIGATKIVYTPMAFAFNIGKQISNAIKSAVTVVRNSFANIGQAGTAMWGIAKNGDPQGVINYQFQDNPENPINGFSSFIIGASKILYTPMAGAFWIGKQISNFITSAATAVSNTFANIGQAGSDMGALAMSGDPGAVMSYELADNPENPVNGFAKFIIGASKILYTPIAGIHWVGNAIHNWFTGVANTVSQSVTTLGEGNATLQEFAKNGDPAGLMASEFQDTEGNPIGGVMGGIYGVMKLVNMPSAIIHWAGAAIKSGFDAMVTTVNSNRETLSTSNTKLGEYAKSGDLGAIWNEKLSLKSGDPLGAIWHISFGISKLFNSAIAIFNSVLEPIKGVVEGVTQGFNGLVDAVKNFDPLGAFGNLFDGFLQGVKDFVGSDSDDDGGSGVGIRRRVRGGRGQPSILNGIPYYSQNDSRWANNSYESSTNKDGATMADTGCGPAAMSMVIGGMNNRNPSPTELANFASRSGDRDNTGTNWNFIDRSANAYGLGSTRITNPNANAVTENLKSGTPMVLSGQSDSSGPYTRAGHYIVATGVDSSGNVTYNDPRGASYSGTMNINDFINNTGAAWTFTGPDAPRGSYGTSSISNRQRFNLYEWTKGGHGAVAQDTSMGGGVKTQSGSGVTSNDIISIALNEVGYFAKRSNSDLDSKTANALGAGQYNGYCKYARDTWPGKNGLAWCAMFVCWVFKMAANGKEDVAKKLLCGGGYSAGCTQMLKAFGAKGQLISKNSTPIPGDVVLFNWDNGNSTSVAQHVGIVVGVNGDKVTTVEGNTSATSQGHGGCVEKKDRSRKNIICFCRPIYDNTSNFQGLSSLGGTDGGFATTLSSTGGAALSGNILNDYSSLFSAFANASFNAALTGNTDIDWNAVFSGASTGTSGASVGSTEYSTSGGVVDPGDINERTKKVVEFFRSKGINDAAIAGILGCWKAESGVTPGKVEGYYLKGYPSGLNYAVDRGAVDSFTQNVLFPAYARSGISINKKAYYGQDGHLYPGAGLAQWTGPRGQAYANMFASKGYKFGQIEPELEMVWSELNGGCRSYALAPLKSVTTPEAGADVFCRKFEGYGGADGIRKRQGYARGFYNSMSSLAGDTGGGSGEGAPKSENGPTLASHRYTIAPPKPVEGGSGEGVTEKIKAPINTHQLSKSSKFTTLVNGGMGSGYDDRMVLELLNQIAGFLGTITTNTKNLDLLNDIRNMTGTSNVNVTSVTGGDTTVNTVNNTTTRKNVNRTATTMTRQESNARKIAGIG